jgi:hypothetical protein
MCIIGKRGQDIYIKPYRFPVYNCLLLIGQYLILKQNKKGHVTLQQISRKKSKQNIPGQKRKCSFSRGLHPFLNRMVQLLLLVEFIAMRTP